MSFSDTSCDDVNITTSSLSGEGRSAVTGLPDLAQFEDLERAFRASLYRYNEPVNAILIAFYVIVFLMSLVGNIFVLLVIRADKSIRNVTNYFLLNLAIADLLGRILLLYIYVIHM